VARKKRAKRAAKRHRPGGGRERRDVRLATATGEDRLASLVAQAVSKLLEPRTSGSSLREVRLEYALELGASRDERGVVLLVTERRRRFGATGSKARSGGWSEPIPFHQKDWDSRRERVFADDLDKRIASVLPGGERAVFYPAGPGARDGRFTLDRAQQEILLPLLARSGRCRLAGSAPERVLAWEQHDQPWLPGVHLVRDAHGGESRLEAFLGRGAERLPIELAERLFPAGFVLHEGRLARLDPRGAAGWLAARWREGPRRVPREREAELVDELAALRAFPWIELEEAAEEPPLPLLEIQGAREARDERVPLTCRVLFDYGGTRVRPAGPRAVLLGARDGLPHRRSAASEAARMAELLATGVLRIAVGDDVDGLVEIDHLSGVVRALLDLGWRVEAEGRSVRRASAAGYRVTSGIDWFELAGRVEYDGASAPVAALALAARSGARMVLLGDGSCGLLPEEWLARWELLAAAGEVEGEALRFARSQAFLIDAACRQPDGAGGGDGVSVEVDGSFARLCAELARFTRLEPENEPPGFHGTLRPYQRLSLAWFELLRAAGLGGCLADGGESARAPGVEAGARARRPGQGRLAPARAHARGPRGAAVLIRCHWRGQFIATYLEHPPARTAPARGAHAPAVDHARARAGRRGRFFVTPGVEEHPIGHGTEAVPLATMIGRLPKCGQSGALFDGRPWTERSASASAE
jgi:hypothetical protein